MTVGRLNRHTALRLLAAIGALVATAVASPTPAQRSDTYGRPATFVDRPERGALVHVDAGSRLWSRPDASGTSVIRVDAAIELPVLEHRPGWVKVRYAGHVGWLPAIDTAAAPTSTPAALRADPARLARARQLLGPSRSPRRCGFLPLYTDVDDAPLLARLSQVLAALPAAYAARYGLSPDGAPVEAIVLFRRRNDFAAFSRSETELAHLQIAGFSRDGLAVAYVGDQTGEAVAHDLVHEVTHLLNRRVFDVALPPWLEEGMANDLGYSRIAPNGKLIPGSLSGAREESEVGRYTSGGWLSIDKRVRESGAVAAWARVRALAADGRMDDPARLTSLTWRDFVAERGRQQRYDEATFFVRYLLDAGHADVRQRFLAALHELAGEPEASNGRNDPLAWSQRPGLGAGYRAWLLSTAAAPE